MFMFFTLLYNVLVSEYKEKSHGLPTMTEILKEYVNATNINFLCYINQYHNNIIFILSIAIF